MGSCDGEHKPFDIPLFHRYADAKGCIWAIRCPKSLTKAERERAYVDQPEGARHDILASLDDSGKAVFFALVALGASILARVG